EQPDSESQQAIERIEDEVGRQDADLIALYSDDELTVDDPEFSAAVRDAAVKARGHDAVTNVTSYYETQAPNLVSEDRHATYVVVQLAGEPDTDTIADVRDELAADGLTTQVGGQKAIFLDVNSQVSADIARAEM